MVAVRVWDLDGRFPLGFQNIDAKALERAEQLARDRGAVEVAGLVRVALRDLDLAQTEGIDLTWAKAQENESSLPKGYRLDSEEGLVRDSIQVTEMELG